MRFFCITPKYGKRKLFLLHLCKAIAAVYGTIFSGSERNLSNTAAGSAGSLEHFSFALCAVLSCVTAGLASLRFVLEALFSIKLLLAGCENELISALLTY